MVFIITDAVTYGPNFGVHIIDTESGNTVVALSISKGCDNTPRNKAMALLDISSSEFYSHICISGDGYVVCDRQKTFHTVILESLGATVDYINCIRLDNRKINLRLINGGNNKTYSSDTYNEAPAQLKPVVNTLPMHMRWDPVHGSFISDKFAIKSTDSKSVNIIDKFRDAAIKLKAAIGGDKMYSQYIAEVMQLHDEYIRINKMVHSKYPQHFDMYSDKSDNMHLSTLDYITHCISKIDALDEDGVVIQKQKDIVFRKDIPNNTCFMKHYSNFSIEIVFDLNFLEFFENGLKVDFTTTPVVTIDTEQILLRDYVWKYVLKRTIPSGYMIQSVEH